MVDGSRIRGNMQHSAIAVIHGAVTKHPTVTQLPRERRAYCRVTVDVRGRTYEADAYDKAAEACATVLAGSQVRLICDLVQHEIRPPGESARYNLALEVRHIKVLRTPQRGLR